MRESCTISANSNWKLSNLNRIIQKIGDFFSLSVIYKIFRSKLIAEHE